MSLTQVDNHKSFHKLFIECLRNKDDPPKKKLI
jgi:hypothetical protein